MNAEATVVRDTNALRAAVPGRWSAPPTDGAIRAAATLGMLPLRLLGTRMGKRLAATAALSILLVGAVSALYDHADGPVGAKRPAAAERTLSAAPAAASKPAAGKGKAADASHRASPAAGAIAKSPEAAAIAWYAARTKVPSDRVQALQRQRISATSFRVLVMAQVSPTDLPTAFATAKRVGSGWKVP